MFFYFSWCFHVIPMTWFNCCFFTDSKRISRISQVHRIHFSDWLVPANMRPVAGPQECCDICTSQSADNPPCALGVERFRIIDVTALKVCFIYNIYIYILFIYLFCFFVCLFVYYLFILFMYLCMYLFTYLLYISHTCLYNSIHIILNDIKSGYIYNII